MGLSASQSRLLSLTARLSDLELNMQTISNSKIRLADASAEVSKRYTQALNEEKYSILTGISDSGEYTYAALTYNNLAGPNTPLLAQYCVTDNNGNVTVTEDIADAFRNSSSLNGFLENTGARTITYPNGMTPEEFDVMYNQLSANVTAALSELDEFGRAHVKGYTGGGAWSYNTEARNTETDIDENGDGVHGDPHHEYTTSNGSLVSFFQKGQNGAIYNMFEGDNIRVYGTIKDTFIKETTITTGSNTLTYSRFDDKKLRLTRADGTTTVVSNTTGNQRVALTDENGNIEGYYTYKDNKLTITPADGTGKVEVYLQSAIRIDPSGEFADLGGIIGTVIRDNRTDLDGQSGTPAVEAFCETFRVAQANIDTDYEYDGDTTVTRSSSDTNADSYIIFLDDNGKEVTNKEQIISYMRLYSSLRTAYAQAAAAFEDLGGAAVVDIENVDYYTNLYNRMQAGYITIDNNNLNNAEWMQAQIQCGNLLLEKFVDGKWQSISWSTCMDIAETSDESDVAKAEAAYEAAMAQIKTKDTRFDLELKNINTEHSAIQTEIDSVKKVIDKNIERTFKIFDA